MCCDHGHHVSDLASDGIAELLELMVREVYRLQGTDGGINEAVAKFFSEKIWGGVTKGYGISLDDAVYDSPDYNMLTSLKENVWQFSAAKNYSQLRELSDALLDENGQLRTFEQFKELARIINDKYVKTWLKTEYELAVAGGQMAGKWVDIIRNKSSLPLLQFDAVMDNRTTELCSGLNDVILPVDHPFWNRFYPPNHFGCRSTVRQLATGKVTPDDKIPSAEVPKMFQTNLGKNGLIFPEDHPYFIGLPEALRK